jgi:hypothetical protein
MPLAIRSPGSGGVAPAGTAQIARTSTQQPRTKRGDIALGTLPIAEAESCGSQARLQNRYARP